MRPVSLKMFLSGWLALLLGLSVSVRASSILGNTHRMTIGARCDLVSAPQRDTTACLDVSQLDGTTLRVPGSTTRISSQGLVLCGKKDQSTDPMDIAYVVDQSGSMQVQSVLPLGKDTIAYYDCAAPSLTATSPIAVYHGTAAFVISPSDSAYCRQACHQAGDPTSIRGELVQDAILQQAKLAPASQAAWIPFSGFYTSTGMVSLSDTASRGALLRSIQNSAWTNTNYEGPLGWARILLQGGTGTGAIPVFSGSRNPRKAIFMISDGEPTDTGWLGALGAKDSIGDPSGNAAYTSTLPSPPIYGFLISESTRPGKALQTLANSTGGQFFQIPPSRPDSLRRTLTRILGSILGVGRPDSLRIVNTTNGQVSTGVTGQKDGGGYRVRLDSIVGLQPGPNVLELRFVLTGGVRDSIVTARWTIVVSDTAPLYSASGADSVLMASCGPASALSLRPQLDTTRVFADARDLSLRWLLDSKAEPMGTAFVDFNTIHSKDRGIAPLSIPVPSGPGRQLRSGVISWASALQAVGGDGIIQTSDGWDTIRSVFRMPRDSRDSAVAMLPVLHPWIPKIWFAPDTVDGLIGGLRVRVRDGNITSDTVVVRAFHRQGDTVSIVLRRMNGMEFGGQVSFDHGTKNDKDSVLQLGPIGRDPVDSVVALYQGIYRDTALVRRPSERLRFVDSLGRPVDRLPGFSLDVGGKATVRVGLFVEDKLLTTSDSVSLAYPAWIEVLAPSGSKSLKGVRLSGGLATLVVWGAGLGADGRLTLTRYGVKDSLVISPIRVSAYRLMFAKRGATLSDTLSIVGELRKSEVFQVVVWGNGGPCNTCVGSLRAVLGDPQLKVTDSAGGAAILVRGGQAWVRVRADQLVVNGWLDLSLDSLQATGRVSPIQFLAPLPDSVEYFDTDGDGALDLARVHLRSPWSRKADFGLPWPDSARLLDLASAKVALTPDSMRIDFSWPTGNPKGVTGWPGAQRPSASWSSGPGLIPIRERIPPVPLRAKLLRGMQVDTLRVSVSEPLDSGRLAIRSPLLAKLGATASLLSGRPFRWDGARRELSILLPSDSVDFLVVPGDSVRFPASGAIADGFGNAPGVVAAAVVVEGTDRPPYLAGVFDRDADGRADQVVLRFATRPRSIDAFDFGWATADGGVERRVVSFSQAIADSSGRILSISLPPFAFGATSCPIVGCRGLGRMISSRWGDTARSSFDQQDSIAPIILDGVLRFGRRPDLPDSLFVTLSEPTHALPFTEWIRLGKPGKDSLGGSIGRWSQQQTDPWRMFLVLDSSFQGRSGDSLRLAAFPGGGVSGFDGVSPKRFAHWAPLSLGPVPQRFVVTTWPQSVVYRNWVVPADEPALSLYVRPNDSDPWQGLDGNPPSQDPTHYVGVLIRSNIDMDVAAMYVYDNIGTAVARIDLAPLRRAFEEGKLRTSLKGDFQVWVAWNGRSQSGKVAASGIYPVRVVGWRRENRKIEVLNIIKKLSWIVPVQSK